MKLFSRISVCLFVVVTIVGCASTSNVTARHEYKGGKIARPDHILVYDFAPPRNVPAESASAVQSAGAEITKALVEDIRGMGLPAKRVSNKTAPQIGDLVLKGRLISIDEGDTTNRIAIGFGSGASSVKAAVEGFLMTNHGLKKLGSGKVDSSGSTSPGAALGVVGTIATANPAGLIISSGMKVYGEASGSSKVEGRAKQIAEEISNVLQVKFKEQGWI